MAFKDVITAHPRVATALVVAVLVGLGSFWLATLTVPCVGRISSPYEAMFCMRSYIMKFAVLAYPIAIISSFLAVGCTVLLLSAQNRYRNPLYCSVFAVIGGIVAYPVAGFIAVSLLKAIDGYWRSIQSVWMFERLVIGSFWMTWPYALLGAALAGGLASMIVRAVTKTTE